MNPIFLQFWYIANWDPTSLLMGSCISVDKVIRAISCYIHMYNQRQRCVGWSMPLSQSVSIFPCVSTIKIPYWPSSSKIIHCKSVQYSLKTCRKKACLTYLSKSTSEAGMVPGTVCVTLNFSFRYLAILCKLIGRAGRRNLSRAAIILDLYSLSDPHMTISR